MNLVWCDLSATAPESASWFHHSPEQSTDRLVHWVAAHLGSDQLGAWPDSAEEPLWVRWRCPRTPPQPYPFVVVVQRSPVWRSWNYLKAILEVFGFDLRWIYWIMPFIFSLNYFILLNEVPSTPFNATWGLRQGDPLSPFLFIIAAEGLGWHIKSKIQGG